MKIDTLGVQAFVAVAETGGFHKAAERLFITQTALTRRLQNLEAALGLTLIERTTRSVALSAIGAEFLPQARRLLAELEAALTELAESGRAQRGDVTIACVPTVGIQFLPDIIFAYAARHPDNRIKILDHSSAGVAEAVLRREAEFGITIAGPQHGELESLPLTTDRFVLVCRTDHPLAGRRRLAWRALSGQRLIFAGMSSSNRPLLDLALGNQGPVLQSQYEVQRSSTALGLAAAGVGAAVVPRLAIQDGTYPMLRVIALDEPEVSRELVLVLRRHAQLSPAAQALFDLLRAAARPDGHEAAGRRKPARRGVL